MWLFYSLIFRVEEYLFQHFLPDTQFFEGDTMECLFQCLPCYDTRLFFQLLPVFGQWIRLVRRSFLSEMRTTRCWRSILSIKRVILGLSLKVALHNSCWVTPSFYHRKISTVHCSGLISNPFWRKLRYSFRLIAAETLPFSMANISRISKLNCSIMKLLFKQLCKGKPLLG